MTKQSAPPTGPLSEKEIEAALENEGYPFELRVFQLLEDLDWNPFFGERLWVNGEEGPLRETDVVAQRSVYIKRDAAEIGFVHLNLVIEAKKIHEGAFVGFPSNDEFTPPALRCGAIGGAPSFGVLEAMHEAAFATFYGSGCDEHLGAAFTGMIEDIPYCIQWALPRRIQPKNGRSLAADHVQSVAQDLAGVVETSAKIAHNATYARLNAANSKTELELVVALPVLVLDAPIYTYDVNTKHLTPEHRILVRVVSDTVLTRADANLVDVVDMVGLEQLVESTQQALSLVREELNVPHYRDSLVELAKTQTTQWRDAQLLTAWGRAPFPGRRDPYPR